MPVHSYEHSHSGSRVWPFFALSLASLLVYVLDKVELDSCHVLALLLLDTVIFFVMKFTFIWATPINAGEPMRHDLASQETLS